jgi:hypothetical protein
MDFNKFLQNKKASVLNEMAQRLDVVKKPIKTDKETIHFLAQFPAHYWPQALATRMNRDLLDGLKEREERRKPIREKVENLLNHFFSGTAQAEDLKDIVSDELYEKLKSGEYNKFQGKGNQRLAKDASAKLAELEAEKQVPHVKEFKNRVYVFKNGKKEEQYIGNPYINRLVHKLEKNYGEEHHPESGMKDTGTTHGEYGYDLHDIQMGINGLPHSTRGMQLPLPTQTRQRIGEFLNHNFHQMYGSLPESALKNGEKVTWKPVGNGKLTFEDTWTLNKLKKDLTSKWSSKLKTEEKITMPDGEVIIPNKIPTRSEYEKIVRRLVESELLEKIKAGEVKGPPVPGLHPEGLPFKAVENPDGTHSIQAPPLYLPFIKRKLIKLVGGKQVVTEEDIPFVKPMEYLRKVGTEKGDENIPDSEKTGVNKEYVKVPHDKYNKEAGYIAGGGLHPNQNSDERMYLGESDPEFKETREKIFNDMKEVTKDGNKFYKDILYGITGCISSGCGGITGYEAKILKNSLSDLHSMVIIKMLTNLRNPKLLEPKGRMGYARNVITSWAQQNLEGGGTRRRRWLNDALRPKSLNAGEDGNSLDQTVAADDNKMKGLSNKVSGLNLGVKLGQGGRKRITGQGEFAYHVDNLRKLISQLSGEGKQADDNIQKVHDAGLDHATEDLFKLMSDAVADKVEVLGKLTEILKAMYIYTGFPEDKALEKAEAKVELYSKYSNSTEQIINGFKNDPDNAKILEDLEKIKKAKENDEDPAVSPESISDEDVKAAVETFNDMIEKIKDNKMDFNSPLVKQNLENYVNSKQSEPAIYHALKDVLAKVYSNTPTSAGLSPELERAKQLSNLIVNSHGKFLHSEMIELSKNKEFLDKAPAASLKSLLEKMKLAVAERPDLVKAYSNAMMRLSTAIEEK